MANYGTLTITGPDGVSHVVALDRPEIIIGRDVGSDILLDDPQASRFHARINCGPEGCAIADLVSSNGTRVNGQRIKQPVDISGGATIQIGSYTLAFQPGMGAAGPAPTVSLPYRSSSTMAAGEMGQGATLANSLAIFLAAAGVVILVGMLGCSAAYLLGFDALMTPSLRAASELVPGVGVPLADFYDGLHAEEQAAAPAAPTATPTPNAAGQPTPEAADETEEAAPQATEEAPAEEAGGGEATSTPGGPTLAPSITVRNESNLAFCGVFIRESGTTFWGDNRLTGAQLPIGDDQLVTIPGPGTYDIRVMDCSSPRITLENKLDVEVTEPYEWVVDERYTLPPTATPTPTVTPTPEATPIVSFYADDYDIKEGKCTEVHWNTENISAVYFQNNPVVGNDGRTVCPNNTKTYTLTVNYRDGSVHEFEVTIEVEAP